MPIPILSTSHSSSRVASGERPSKSVRLAESPHFLGEDPPSPSPPAVQPQLGERRKVDWKRATPPTPLPSPPFDLDSLLHSHLNPAENPSDALLIATTLTSYDLCHTPLGPASTGRLHQACLVWKQPARRRAMKHLLLRHSGLDEEAGHILAKFVRQAPTWSAPLHLQRLDLSENDLWAGSLASLLQAFTHNEHASVAQLDLSNTHVGSVGAMLAAERMRLAQEKLEQLALAAAEGEQGVETEAGQITTDTNTLSSSASSPPLTLLSASTLCFSPLLSFLFAPHCQLTVLRLNQCILSDFSVAYLSEGLRSNRTLLELHLDENDLTDAAAMMLAEALGGRGHEEQAAREALLAPAPDSLTRPATADGGENAPARRANSRGGARGGAAGAGNKLAPPSAAASPPSPTASGAASRKGSAAKEVRGSKEEIVEEAVDPSLSSSLPLPLPSFHPSSLTNSSLRILSLRGNRIGVEGLQHLDSAVRHHPSLIRCHVDAQRGVSVSQQEQHLSLRHQIRASCEANAYVRMREIKMALAMGFHPRVGACSTLQTLVEESKKAAAAADQTGASRAQVNSRHKQAASQQMRQTAPSPSIPRLSIGAATALTQEPSLSPSSSSPAHALFLQQALEPLWQFLAFEQ